MKQLEDVLRKTITPEVRVDRYRQRLRRSLLDSHRYRKSSDFGYRGAFYLSATAAVSCAAILLLFIIQPALPGKIHYALRSDRGTLLAAVDRTVPERDVPEVDAVGQDPDVAYGSVSDNPSYRRQVDQEVVRLLAQSQLKRKNAGVKPIAPNEVYSINRFRMDNGKDVLVYTQMPVKQVSYRESY